jgi:hypothetical protein
MTPLSVEKLRAMAKRNGWRGVVVIAFDDENIAATSYGRDREDCGRMSNLAGRITALIEAGALKVWG